ncbi:MAG: hypothetical protein ACYSUM_12150 [Planctomycetota bacterium]|jgi:hypothetical protein
MKRRWVVLLVGLAAFLVHLPAKGGGFLFYDDERFVVLNREIEHIGNPLRFFVDLETTATKEKPTTDIYRPVRTLSYAVLHQLFGKQGPARWHGFAILLHAGCAMLLTWLLLVAGCGRWPAAAGALLFALHPVTVETTAWICSLGDLWCGLFVLLSMLAWAKDRRILAHLALVCALFSKEHAVVVPGLWLAWDFFLRRERVHASKTLLSGAVAGLAVVVGFLVFRGFIGARLAQVDGPLGGSQATALLTMLGGAGYYAVRLLFPFGPSFDARVDVQESLFALPVWLGLAFLALLVLGVLRGTPRTRLACVWFLMALVPVSNVFVPLKIPTADRFLYVPLMGLAFCGAEAARRAYPLSAKLMPAAFVLLAALTVGRIGDWRDDASLLAAGLSVHPKSRMLLWAEAALEAKTAVRLLAAGDPAGVPHAVEAGQLYEMYMRNSHASEQTQAWVEVGDLQYALGSWQQRYEPTGTHRGSFDKALRAYVRAGIWQKLGVGRVIGEEVVHVMWRVADLSVKLAEPRNKELHATIKVGREALDFLEKNTGFDARLMRTQLLLVESVDIRGEAPKKAREGFDGVLRTIDELEKDGMRHLTYLKAQAHMYRSILKDRDSFNRNELEAAYELYLQAVRETPTIRVQALIYAGRAAGKIGQLFGDEEWLGKGIEVLQAIPEIAKRDRLQVTAEQRRKIDSLLREFRAR